MLFGNACILKKVSILEFLFMMMKCLKVIYPITSDTIP